MLRSIPLSVALATGLSLPAQNVQATVLPPGGGAPVQVPIGTLNINTAPNGVIRAEFQFNGPDAANGFPGGYRFLDAWYDFRWINIVTGYTNAAGVQATNAAGDPIAPGLGEIPAMDPQPGGAQWFNDGEPFYYPGATWAAGTFGPDKINKNAPAPGAPVSKFVDMRANHPVGTTITFECYLVARSITDPGIAPNEIVVLTGFRWTHGSGTGPAGTNVATVVGPLAPNPPLINQSMGMAGGGAGFPPVAGAGAWFALPSGLAPVGRVLRQCIPAAPAWQRFGTGCLPFASLGLDLLGHPLVGAAFDLLMYDQTPNPSLGLLMVSPTAIYPGIDLGFVGAPGCKLYVDPATAVGFPVLSPNPSVTIPIPNSPTLAGLTLFAQGAWFDPLANQLGFRTSNGVSIFVGF